MKKLYTTLFSMFVATAGLMAQTSFTLQADYDWYTAYTNPGTDAAQCTLSPYGKIYALSNTAEFATGIKGIYMIDQNGGSLINSGMGTAGTANAFDDAGNYVYHANYGSNRGGDQKKGATATCFRYKIPDATTGLISGGAYINATSINFGRPSWYIDVTGNVKSGTSYIWTVPSSADPNILALKMENAVITEKLSFNVADAGVDVSGIGVDCQIQFYDTEDPSSYKCMMQLRGKGIYDVTLNLNTKKVVECNQIPDANANCNSLGTHIFTFNDHKFLVRNTRRVGSTGGAKNLCTEFEVLDITDSYSDPVSCGVRDPFPSASAGVNTGSYIQTSVSGNVAKIYAYAMGNGVACYSLVVVTTGLEDLEIDAQEQEPVYYNLQGVQVENPTSGIYIVKRGNKVTKERIVR